MEISEHSLESKSYQTMAFEQELGDSDTTGNPLQDIGDSSHNVDPNAIGFAPLGEESTERASWPVKTLDDLIDTMPQGRFHWRLLLICGLSFMADSMEVTLLSFISMCASVQWHLPDSEMASITSAVFAGQFVGGLFWGPIADRFGRRKAFICCICVISSAGVLASFAPNYPVLLFLLMMNGFGIGGLTVPFDLLAELVPSNGRGKWLVTMNYFWTLGSMYVIISAWLILSKHDWKFLTFLTAVPVIIASIVCFLWLPESPRWLLETGQVAEAERAIKDAIRFNNGSLKTEKKVSLKFTLAADPCSSRQVSVANDAPRGLEAGSPSHTNANAAVSHKANEHEKSITFCEFITLNFKAYANLLRAENIGFSPPLWVLWFCFGFAYYAVILFVSRLYNSGSAAALVCSFDYENILINASSEMLALFLSVQVVDVWGRPKLMVCTFFMAGVTALCMGFKSTALFTLIIGCVARMSIMVANSTVWVTTPELFRTELRASAHSFCNAFARIGAFLCPFVVESKLSDYTVGLVILGVNIVAAITATTIPDMTGRDIDNPNVDQQTGAALDPSKFYLFGGVPKNFLRKIFGGTCIKEAEFS